MHRAARIRDALSDPELRRWALAISGVVALHLGLFALLPPGRLNTRKPEQGQIVSPIFVQLTPRARRPSQSTTETGQERVSSEPPVVVRSARPAQSESPVAPLVVDTPPPNFRPRTPGRVIPQSWRERCGLGDGEVSDAAYRACRDGFLQAAAPPPGPPNRRRGDPSQDFAAQGAARIAAYEAQRAPAPTGSGNAGPSSTPGGNFGMGEIDRSVVYIQGDRPRTD